MMIPACLLLSGLVLGDSGNTTAIRVLLREVGASSSSTTGVEGVQVVAEPVAYEASAKIGGDVVANVTGGRATLNLAAGTWTVAARKKGFWGATETLSVDGAGGERPAVTLKLWPVGLVAGSIVAPAADVSPDRLTLVFAPSRQTGVPAEDRLPAEASVVCPVRDGSWSCELPSQTLDFHLKARPFVPHYRWDVEVRPNARVELGIVTLRRGASVAGWVKTADGAPPGSTCRVELKTSHEESIKGPGQSIHADSPPFAATVNHRGFFQIAGVPAADYAVTAEAGSLAADAQRIQVYRDSESFLREPLILSAPLALDLLLDPPLDPWDKPWSVRLLRESGHHPMPIGGSSPAKAGVWRREGLRPGSYIVMVLAESGSRWFNETIDLREGTVPVRIDLPVMKVKGTLTMGKKPLSATVIFGGRHGGVSVPLEADAEGNFAGLLPQDRTTTQDWDIEVTASDPPVQRLFEGIAVSAPQGGEAEVELTLPATRLKGTVVDTQGRPVKAIVDDHSIGEVTPLVQAVTEDDGRFELNGVVMGPHLLSAQARGGLSSDQVPVTVEQGVEATVVRLIVGDEMVVKGQILSTEGVVPGARIMATPIQGVNVSRIRRSDSEGRFELRLPRGTTEVGLSVDAPGYALRTFRAPLRPETPLNVLLGRLAGKLVLELPPLTDTRAGAPVVLLIHGGYLVNLLYLMEWAEINGGGVNDAGQTVIPQVEPGPYTACVATLTDYAALIAGHFPKDRCVTDTLAPGGEMLLKVPASPAKSSGRQ